MLDQQTS